MPAAPAGLQQSLADRYRIEREIGAGGMATVYLAHDLKHGRPVALKVLRQELTMAMGADRFHREIEIAARLQHPNIVPLHDSGEAAGSLYYVMPFIEGRSLRERLVREGALPVADVLRILRDVADALTEAHLHGVVHRDIKPENIMLRGRHALVTDFGVAKAVSEATGRQAITTAGIALGTPDYMAPEQASADPHLDHRVDIYALGSVAYELLTGRPVFMGTTAKMKLAAHLTEIPAPVSKYRETVPRPLEALVMRCLEKQPADRWQSAEELLVQLEVLATPSGGVTPTSTAPIQAAVPRRRAFAGGAVAGILGLVAIGVILGQPLRSKSLNVTASNLIQVTAEPGVEFEPALSPDGKEVAYVVGPLSATHVAVRSTSSTAAGGEVRLSDTSLAAYVPVWSASGDLVRFAGCRESCFWYETGELGGSIRRARVPPLGASRSLAWSPDGSQVVFEFRDTIFVSSAADSGTVHRVGLQPLPADLHSFVWSPDGKLIAYVNANSQWLVSANVLGSSIWIVSPSGGIHYEVTSDKYLNVSPVWMDNQHLLFISNRDGARGVYVIEVGPKGARGDPRTIPGIADPHSISYSQSSHLLAWSKFTIRQNIWSFPLDRPRPVSIREGIRVTTGNEVSEVSDVSPDGKWLAFDSNRRGNMDIYRMPVGGGDAVRLTDSPQDEFNPQWSPDGKEIAFYGAVHYSTGDSGAILLMPASGGKTSVLAVGAGYNDYPSWSPDGLDIAFQSNRTGRGQVWLLSRDSVGGPWHHEIQLTDSGGVDVGWVANGEVLCARRGLKVFFLSRERRVLRQWDLAALGFIDGGGARVSRDGRAFYMRLQHRDGRTGVWRVSMSGGAPRLIIAQDNPLLAFFVGGVPAVTGDRLYHAVSEFESDIWVAKLSW